MIGISYHRNVPIRKNFLHASNLALHQPYLYSMRVVRRIGQQIFHNADGLFAGSLVLFQDDGDAEAGVDIFSFAVRHGLVRAILKKALNSKLVPS